ncbi:AAA family ATPase [Mycolicibacterium novocastrense]|uniref:AAA family ATPase n=1 Tax=Mycolicibacterium novocastrense TaxID=59813 RepID=A0AAW5SEM7_MYCNV|nr:adenylate/guanylate cyclase domain-containing protein [Mycolicibacterium novocastrense]MCV7022218.1 AAA family ATPase [Mycolicibacterium novocastrense]GAT10102.1 adenylate/guanylate cyclase family protein [Mycolicibacterium novocastrense]
MADRATAASERCGACDNDLRTTARFCDACGAPVAPSAAKREHKQITVLFADVVGSMNLAATLTAERLQEVMNSLFNGASAVVQRYQGTVDKFTGDGLMALFGAPLALEDHALRACIAALEIQVVAERLADEVHRRDGVDLKLRIGLNSGAAIVGEIGLGPGRYTAVGHPVGLAQRMEAGAPPGGVMCSLTTARMVEGAARFGAVETIAVKNAGEGVPARRLLAIESDRRVVGRNEGLMLGRDDDLRLLRDVVDSSRGALVGIVGAPGVGKSRLISEFGAVVAGPAVRVVTARCEAHITAVAFRVLARLLRALFDVQEASDSEARQKTIAQYNGQLAPDSADANILFEAMGIAEPTADVIHVSVDGRRRRLAASICGALRAFKWRTVLFVDDVHWIDAPSDAVLADVAARLGTTTTTMVITYRPEYAGALRHHSHRTIALQPLTDKTTARLVRQLLGRDPSVEGMAQRIAVAAAGNPFFAEEIVRDLAGRGVLSGSRGDYRLASTAEEIAVPATAQAVLAARIDRLSAESKAILNAAAVIGTRFDPETLNILIPEMDSRQLADLVSAELIDQTEFVPRQRFCFRHPLVRTVAYESQLGSTRALAHARLATAIEERDPGVSENATLIATHLEAAGELTRAYRWHLRAAEWLRYRDLPAARAEWDSAQRIADRLAGDDDDIVAMRITPRTMLISTALYVGDDDAGERYQELRDLTTRIGDVTSLALATAGRVMSLILNNKCVRDAAVLADELEAMVALVDCDPATRSIILVAVAFARFTDCDFDAALRVIEEMVSLTREEPTMELAVSKSISAYIAICRGEHRRGRSLLQEGLDTARSLHPANYAIILNYLGILVAVGMLRADELVDEVSDALRRAESFGGICGIICAESACGTVLLRTGKEMRDEAMTLLRQARTNMRRYSVFTIVDGTIGADLAVGAYRNGQRDEAIDDLRALVAAHINDGSRLIACRTAEALVELLIDRGSADDLNEVRRFLADSRSWHPGFPAADLWGLRSRALLARAHRDPAGYAGFASEYLALCETLSAQGRIADARRMVNESVERSAG